LAYVWYQLAAEGGNLEAGGARDAAAARLNPEALADARERLNQYRTLYGSADSEWRD
jgi:TPR repeat protein